MGIQLMLEKASVCIKITLKCWVGHTLLAPTPQLRLLKTCMKVYIPGRGKRWHISSHYRNKKAILGVGRGRVFLIALLFFHNSASNELLFVP